MASATRRASMVARAAVSWARRGMSSVGASPYDTGFLEVRQYTLVPEKMKEYMQLAGATAELRKRLNPGFLSFFTCDTGSVLNRVTHFYHYKDLDERERVRKTMAENPEWQEFIDKSRPGLQMQESMLFLQAVECHKAAGSCNVNEFESPPKPAPGQPTPIYEIRTYQLDPGYGSAPKLRKIFAKGLPAKVAADSDGKLVFLGYTDVGKLNYVMEVWRYSSAQASIEARRAARAVEDWRQAIAAVTPMVQVFETRIMVPAIFSPWQ